MEGANFEKKLKDNLADYPSPLDLELEWAELDARRNKKRKKRPFFWIWWATGVFLLAGSILVFWNYSKSTKTIADHKEIVADRNQKEIAPGKQKLSSPIDLQDELISETTPAPASPQKTNKETNTAIFQNNKTSNKSKTITTSKFKQAETQSNIPDLSSSVQSTRSDANQSSLKLSINQKDVPLLLLPIKLNLIPISKSFPTLALEHYPKASIAKTLKKKSPWVLGFSTSYGKSIRNLTALEENLAPLVDRRNLAEKALDIWQTSLILRKNINDKWFMDLGLGYGQSTDRFKDIKIEQSYPVKEDQIISITYMLDGSISEEIGDVIADEMTTSDNTFYQYQGNIFIRLTVGRNFKLNHKNGFSFSTGFKLNAYTFKQGKVFIENDDSYGDLKDYTLRKAGIINAASSLEYYRITKNNIRLAIGLEGEFQFNNTFLKKSGLKETRNFLGLSTSIMKPF